jgi:hypothetical protein
MSKRIKLLSKKPGALKELLEEEAKRKQKVIRDLKTFRFVRSNLDLEKKIFLYEDEINERAVAYFWKGEKLVPIFPFPLVPPDLPFRAKVDTEYRKREGWNCHPYFRCNDGKFIDGEPTESELFAYNRKISYSVLRHRIIPNTKRLIQAVEDTYQTFRLSILYNQRRLDKELVRAVKRKIVDDPYKIALELKEVFFQLRRYYITGQIPELSPLWSSVYGGADGWHAGQISMASRGLPKPWIRDDAPIQELIQRLQQPSSVTEEAIEDFREWVKEWLYIFTPELPRYSWCNYSSSACVEFPTELGGNRAFISHITNYQEERNRNPSSKYDRACLDFLEESKQSLLPRRVESSLLYFGCLNQLRPMIKHMKVCEGPAHCQEFNLHPCICPSIIEEKGMRVRVPTKTHAPLVFLSQILRHYAHAWMKRDPRMSQSVGGKLPFPKVRPKLRGSVSLSLYAQNRLAPLIRSQDLTKATDLHDIRVTKLFYTEMAKYLDRVPFITDIISLLGPFNIMTDLHSCLLEGAPVAIPDSPLYTRNIKPSNIKPVLPLDLFRGSFIRYAPSAIMETVPPERVVGTNHGLTMRGEPMGISTSFVLLPLITCYGFERSGEKEESMIGEFSRTRTLTRLCDCSRQQSLRYGYCDCKIPKPIEQAVDIRKPWDWLRIMTTGDDALFGCTIERSERHTKIISGLGAEVNTTKDFLSPNRGLFAEELYKDGHLARFIPLHVCACPRGVGTPTWFTFPDALASSRKKWDFTELEEVKMLRIHKFKPVWDYLIKRGFPLQLSYTDGGIGLKGYKEVRKLTPLFYKKEEEGPEHEIAPNRLQVRALVEDSYMRAKEVQRVNPYEDTLLLSRAEIIGILNLKNQLADSSKPIKSSKMTLSRFLSDPDRQPIDSRGRREHKRLFAIPQYEINFHISQLGFMPCGQMGVYNLH